MKNLILAGAAFAAMSVAVFACSSSDDGGSTSSSSSGGSSSGASSGGSSSGGITFTCDTKSKCPSEPTWTDDEKAECRALLASDCGDEYQAFGNCFADNETCKSDGTSDAEGARTGACKAQTETYETCLAATHDAGQ